MQRCLENQELTLDQVCSMLLSIGWALMQSRCHHGHMPEIRSEQNCTYVHCRLQTMFPISALQQTTLLA